MSFLTLLLQLGYWEQQSSYFWKEMLEYKLYSCVQRIITNNQPILASQKDSSYNLLVLQLEAIITQGKGNLGIFTSLSFENFFELFLASWEKRLDQFTLTGQALDRYIPFHHSQHSLNDKLLGDFPILILIFHCNLQPLSKLFFQLFNKLVSFLHLEDSLPVYCGGFFSKLQYIYILAFIFSALCSLWNYSSIFYFYSFMILFLSISASSSALSIMLEARCLASLSMASFIFLILSQIFPIAILFELFKIIIDIQSYLRKQKLKKVQLINKLKGKGQFQVINNRQDSNQKQPQYNKMSLIQFVQQTLAKDISTSVLQEIQTVHEATQNLLDTLCSMRDLNKLQIIDRKIKSITDYLEMKENILKFLNGFDNQWFSKWLNEVFNQNPVLKELVRAQKSRIDQLVKNSIRNIFILNQRQEQEKVQEQTLLKYSLQKFNKLKECEVLKKKLSKQQLMEISKLDEKLGEYRKNFDLKVKQFNCEIEDYLQSLKKYESTVQQQFMKLLGSLTKVQVKSRGYDSPFKIIENENNSELSSKTSLRDHIQYDPIRSSKRFLQRVERPVRDIYKYEY